MSFIPMSGGGEGFEVKTSNSITKTLYTDTYTSLGITGWFVSGTVKRAVGVGTVPSIRFVVKDANGNYTTASETITATQNVSVTARCLGLNYGEICAKVASGSGGWSAPFTIKYSESPVEGL